MKNQASQYGGYLIFAVLAIYHLIERNILYMNTTNNRNDFYKEQLDKTLNGNEKMKLPLQHSKKKQAKKCLLMLSQ